MTSQNEEYILVNIPFTLNEDGTLSTTVSIEQYNTLNKFLVSHQKRLDSCSKTMAKRVKSTMFRPKIRYQFMVNESTRAVR